MKENTENDPNKYGHTHPPDLSVVESRETYDDEIPDNVNADWKRISVFSVVAGYSSGVVASPLIKIFDSFKDYSLVGGIGVGILSAIGTAVYTYREEMKH